MLYFPFQYYSKESHVVYFCPTNLVVFCIVKLLLKSVPSDDSILPQNGCLPQRIPTYFEKGIVIYFWLINVALKLKIKINFVYALGFCWCNSRPCIWCHLVLDCQHHAC
jgi:hypothetical protein